MQLDEADCRRRLDEAPFGILGTTDPDGRPHLAPVVLAIDGEDVLIPVDAVKAKRTTRLRRIEHLERSPLASVVVDHRSEDWDDLWWVRADLRYVGRAAADAATPLRSKYDQYRADDTIVEVLRLRIERISGWSAR